MGKKIGIITFHRAINYGAVWQAYALQTFLQKQGFDVEIIDYYAEFLQKKIEKNPRRPFAFLNKLYNRMFFRRFVDKNLKLSSVQYKSEKSILKRMPTYDFYIVGSDTVWNSQIVGKELDVYLMNFVPNDKYKIAYAASLGGWGIKDENIQKFIRYLPTFSAISLREPLFVPQVERIFHNKVFDTVDPSLLLNKEDYFILAKGQKPYKHYILVMDLADDSLLQHVATKVKQILDIPLVSVTGRYKRFVDKNLIGVSPQNWLYLMKEADFICTNSFHGTAFSIVFEKAFLSVEVSSGERSKNNCRVANLLNQTHLSSQLVNSDNIEDKLIVDYSRVKKYINQYINRSVEYLNVALHNENKK